MGCQEYWPLYVMGWANIINFDITTYALMWFVFAANSVEHQALFQSGWFIEGLLSQTLVVHMLRTQKNSVYSKYCCITGVIDHRSNYGHRDLYSFLTIRHISGVRAAAMAIFPLVSGYTDLLLCCCATDEAVLYPPFRRMALRGAVSNSLVDLKTLFRGGCPGIVCVFKRLGMTPSKLRYLSHLFVVT